MERVVLAGALGLAIACRKEPVVESASPTAGLRDTGAGWFPDAYDGLEIPPSPAIAAKWAQDPTRHATYAREAGCEELVTCDSDGLAYRATNGAGERLLVTFNAASVRRAELTRGSETRAFELVYVPGLPYVLVEVERGRGSAWRRYATDVYDPTPAFRRALGQLASPDEAAQLVDSYVAAFGLRDGRFVEDAFQAPVFREPEARSTLVGRLCNGLRLPLETRARTFRLRIDDETVAKALPFYERLFANEKAPLPLAIGVECFTGERSRARPLVAHDLARRYVRATCALANKDAAREVAGRSSYPYSDLEPGAPDLRAAFREETAACPDGPSKQALRDAFDARDHWREESLDLLHGR